MMNGSSLASDANVLDLILKDNLILFENNYIIINVFDEETDQVKSVCLGEIGAIQTDACSQTDAMLDASSSSELQSHASS
ncbi:Late expression factor 10 [Lonomia obliqua multiple nucleopolyhedrovirus]|uniref:Late expression factor 10 n=1 Tax=Lonomia obliqua multiple nucleopolyhedrovirus TaxID=134394 RepID=A0A126FCE1_9ABAC|nr:Late expression factor 10 [Lonomia obliqua multiple nucleopolyhedrovirus]AKN81058.1 Late expression factor 10 [Lonomia obliqua multiple nucleopolyhedrovirus]